MAVLTVQQSLIDGLTVAGSGAGGSDTFANTGREIIYVKNTSGASRNVLVTATKVCDQGFLHDTTGTLATGTDMIMGPFPVTRFGTTVTITYPISGVGVGLSVIRAS